MFISSENNLATNLLQQQHSQHVKNSGKQRPNTGAGDDARPAPARGRTAAPGRHLEACAGLRGAAGGRRKADGAPQAGPRREAGGGSAEGPWRLERGGSSGAGPPEEARRAGWPR